MTNRINNIEMLHDTLQIAERGYYTVGDKEVRLRLAPEEVREIRVYLPDAIETIVTDAASEAPHPADVRSHVSVSCVNADSYALARQRASALGTSSRPVLVLNLANPVNVGGGVYRGAKAQEEDLCRKSTLLLSLESEQAAAYYEYNRALHTYMGSDAVMITPQVEIIKDENGDLLPETVIVAVMTCAAPSLREGMEGLTQEAYEEMIYHRITGMLTVAARLGYQDLVLGAFGCGAFYNDAAIVSDLFYRAMKNFVYHGMRLEDRFRRIDFAVMDHTADQYNYYEFSRNFNDYYREENAAAAAQDDIRSTEAKLDRIRGSLIGGAVGDALGYAIEFDNETEIHLTYGAQGITEYQLTDGVAEISDDTQMTLFTANGILVGDTRMSMRGIGSPPRDYVARAYQDWCWTQDYVMGLTLAQRDDDMRYSWLLDVPELYAHRAPGGTCLTALRYRAKTGLVEDYIHDGINDSKGCGGVMRIAPLALRYRVGENYHGSIEDLDKEAAQLAAITHSHSLGYMPAAVVSHIISGILRDYPDKSLKAIVLEARDTAKKIFAGDPNLDTMTQLINSAVRLAGNKDKDLDNIHALGEGWVAEETMAIAIYCALRYEHDFSKAIIASVNHRGDSDSTGAVTGNIIGAIVGYEAIENKWKQNLELHDVILEMADDLCHGCRMSEYGSYHDPAWETKYIDMHAH